MSVDYSKSQFSSTASSNKVLLQGNGSFSLPLLPGAGSNNGSVTIPHGFSSDNLIYQVTAYSDTVGAAIDPVILPWESNDARVAIYASIDSTNLIITCIHNDASGFGDPARTIYYTYRVLIP